MNNLMKKIVPAVILAAVVSACPLVEPYNIEKTGDNGTDGSILSQILDGNTVIPPLSVASATSVNASGAFADLSWNYISQASGYQIQYCETEDGDFVSVQQNDKLLILSSTTLNYLFNYQFATGESSKTLFFRILSMTKSGSLSAPSKIITVHFSKSNHYNSQVATLYTSRGDQDGITLKWTPVSDADHYLIFRAVAQNGINAKPANAQLIYEYRPINTDSIFQWSDDQSPLAAVVYNYWIQPISEDGAGGIITRCIDSGYIRPYAIDLSASFGSSIRGTTPSDYSVIELNWQAPHSIRMKDELGEWIEATELSEEAIPSRWKRKVAFLGNATNKTYYDIHQQLNAAIPQWPIEVENSFDLLEDSFSTDLIALGYIANKDAGKLYINDSETLFYKDAEDGIMRNFVYRIKLKSQFYTRFYFKGFAPYNEGTANEYERAGAASFQGIAVSPAAITGISNVVISSSDAGDLAQTIEWTSVPSTTLYKLYKYQPGDGKMISITPEGQTETSYMFTADAPGSIFFAISATGANGHESELSTLTAFEFTQGGE